MTLRTTARAFLEQSFSRRIGLVLALSFWGILSIVSYVEYRQEKNALVATVVDQAVIQFELSRLLFAERLGLDNDPELMTEIRSLVEISRNRKTRHTLTSIQDITVLDNEGQVLAHGTQDENNARIVYADKTFIPDAVPGGLATHWNADKSRFAVTADLRWDNRSVGRLYVFFATNMQSGLQALWNRYLLAMVLVGLVALVLSALFTRWVAGPFNSVLPMLGEIGKGDLSFQKLRQLGGELKGITRALETADRRIYKATLELREEIAARHEAEIALSAFKTTLDLTLDCVFMFEPDTLRFSYVNQGATRQVGYSEQELYQMSPVDIKPEFDEARFLSIAEPLVHSDERYIHFETIHQHKDGHRIPVEIFMQYIETAEISPRFIAIVRDISERRAAEAEQQQLMSILEATPDIVGMADAKGRTIFLNAAGRQQLGFGAAEDLSGRKVASYHSDEVASQLRETVFPAAMRDGKWRGETLFQRQDGSEFMTSQVVVAHSGVEGEVSGFSTIARDISNEKAAEHKLRHYQANLERMVEIRTNELALEKDKAEAASIAKTEFLSRMSHELRTPMNAVLGFAQLLESDPDEQLSPRQQENTREILDAGQHLMVLINEVLDLARIDSGRMEISLEEVNLAEVVQASVKLVQMQADSNSIQIISTIAECGDVVVRADVTRLRQILVNLLDNAIKYNRAGGSVTVSCRVAGDALLYLDITDTGRGIREEEMGKLFMPFERLDVKQNVEGTGIGLAICLRLAEMMGGALRVRSAYGEGSTFSIELPLHEKCRPEGTEK